MNPDEEAKFASELSVAVVVPLKFASVLTIVEAVSIFATRVDATKLASVLSEVASVFVLTSFALRFASKVEFICLIFLVKEDEAVLEVVASLAASVFSATNFAVENATDFASIFSLVFLSNEAGVGFNGVSLTGEVDTTFVLELIKEVDSVFVIVLASIFEADVEPTFANDVASLLATGVALILASGVEIASILASEAALLLATVEVARLLAIEVASALASEVEAATIFATLVASIPANGVVCSNSLLVTESEAVAATFAPKFLVLAKDSGASVIVSTFLE
uniref:Candidate secreted effector n=1 Tax=Meloidogyne incognita TaxID=6306 RepID=A0A914L5P8_MELIC